VSTEPACESLTPHVSLPPWFEDRLLYYNGFEQADAELRSEGVAQLVKLDSTQDGFRGRAALTGTGKELRLRSDAFSPHRPLTISFWWALQEDPKLETCFGLVHLAGRGYISHFSRGKGTWCALQRPAAILQVYAIPGIKNVNGIYDSDLRAHVELKAGVWHHTALVVRGASLVEVYTDGRRAWAMRVRGRTFREDDGLRELSVGTRGGIPMAIDEVAVLRRALTPEEIARYVAALSQMRTVDYAL
jgi:hypothetical protein